MANKCREYIKDLNDYLDGEIEPELCEEIEKHIGECRNCRLMVDSMLKTVTLVREGKAEKLPASLEQQLNDKLKARWQKKFKQS